MTLLLCAVDCVQLVCCVMLCCYCISKINAADFLAGQRVQGERVHLINFCCICLATAIFAVVLLLVNKLIKRHLFCGPNQHEQQGK